MSKSPRKNHDEHITSDLVPFVLESMGMLGEDVTQAKSDYQDKLVKTLWTSLKGDERKYIH